MTVTKLFAAVEQLSDAERADALAAARVRNDQTLVGRLDVGGQRLLIKTLRGLAIEGVDSEQEGIAGDVGRTGSTD